MTAPARLERRNPPPFAAMAPILTADGSPVEDFVSTPSWKDLRGGQSDAGHPLAEPIVADWFLDEPHHRYYGRPWIMGRYYFDQILKLGLDRSARVLDFGCGAGRLGALLTAYLDEGGYFGVDNHLRSLVAFAGYECLAHGLVARRPQLLLSDDVELEPFGTAFDLVLDCFATAHLAPERREAAFRRIAGACAPGARLIVLSEAERLPAGMEDFGLRLQETLTVSYPLLGGAREKHRQDDWKIFVRA